MTRIFILLIFLASLALFSCSPTLPEEVEVAMREVPAELDYNIHVKPILSDKCFACHGPDKAKQKAGLRLDLAEFAYADLPENPNKVAINPGNLEKSEFFHRIISDDPNYVMPTPSSHLSLTAKEKAVLIKWIKEGAEYKPHWAFVKPVMPDVPEVENEELVKNPIDNFIQEKLAEEQLSPSKEASKEILLRRLSLDLTGLPPSVQEMDAFLKDNSPNAYEKQVNRLLNSPHYGEKMAVDWLDLARFADSHGYTVDRLRDMSPYRDFVINAFNKNLPYDKFVHWQLAGDLMPKPTKEMMIATAFNRNHQQNMEGGIVEEEFQTEYVIDRTNTFGDAFLGLSVGCAKCHDHKYDPISQKNYYQLFSFFNNVKEAGQISWDDAPPTPTMMLPTKRQEQILHFINTKIAQQEKTIDKQSKEADGSFQKWLTDKSYQTLAKENIPKIGLQALYTFEDGTLKNTVSPKQVAVMKRESGQTGDSPVFENTAKGKTMLMNGDVFLDLNEVGVFRKSQAFTVGIWVNIPKELKEGVILHKSQAERLYNFRGYHLYLKDNKLELNMAHTAPSDAITKVSKQPVLRNQWIQLTITYDGSSKANGFKLYQNGQEMTMETKTDQLKKDILFRTGIQPALQIGGWWRGLGFKNGKVDDISVYNRVLSPYEISVLAQKASWATIANKNINQLSVQELSSLKAFYLSAIYPDLQNSRKVLEKLRTTLADSTEGIEELMVMQEMPKPKKAHILLRGNYDAFGEEVFPNTPESVLAYPDDLPKNRYGLAQWLTHENHPLTARVAVNRFWQNFFGVGLVKTTEDFGNQGEMPSHPKLLDWLAITFRESGWDVKKLNKLIVMSATYRQDSRVNKETREKDPENRLLAHGPVNRMTAEMIRDNALMASGLLNPVIGGKSVKPYQPEGLWEINNTTYKADSGKSVYRRSLYVVVKRAVPNPTLATFDATSRSSCVVRRQKTNTPLQALVTLNDPTFVEASKVMGEQMAKIGDVNKGIIYIYRKLTGRTPHAKEVALLAQLQRVSRAKFQQYPQKAKGILKAGQYVVDKKLDTSLIAANTVVANTILNSDATLTKR
ncbi:MULTISPECIES: DUF1553 domain-containing protein [unclassified Arcicella]|uniref:DUF1553 domain-containing protein n=1 Tax=unclassified Arcicella TaxID=2644986 RepID=UPI00285E0B68|nr:MULTISPECIES: DUF1553 domain-containing protein [unclassified Arcicella]MDR6562006.1 hypothetical protein [Arcicella sp. BE51]MDR6811878.1 hypothetical protein [Arcicella sp. BE140]MDR6822908.1 hypothetical protein [Arcicella sp. BE139]